MSLQRIRSELEEQVSSLEKEVETVTEAGLELNNLLSGFLSAQKGSEDLTKGVELLQQQLNKQLKEIHDGVLGDLAPTILDLMGIEKPEVMTRHSLL